jgi:hypothetical protein
MTTFSSSNTAQIAYAIDKAKEIGDVTATKLQPLNILTSSLKPAMESKTDDSIRPDGQFGISKVVGASCGGDLTFNLRFEEYDDFLRGALRNDWVQDSTDPKRKYLYNGNQQIPFFFEQRVARTEENLTTVTNDFRRFLSHFLTTFSVELAAKDFVSATASFNGLNFALAEADATSNPEAGKLPTVATYGDFNPRDPFDASNSLDMLVFKDKNCNTLPIVLETGSLTFDSNTREDAAVGHKYAANIGLGRLAVTLDGTLYYSGQQVIKALMGDENLSLQFRLTDGFDVYIITLPKLRVMTDDEDLSAGVDNTLKTPFTAQAFPTDVVINGNSVSATVLIEKYDGGGSSADVYSCFLQPTPVPVTHTLTYVADTNGTIVGRAVQTVADGADGTSVTAVPNAGYKFDEWDDGVLTATRTDLAVTTDITVEAQFILE